MNESLMSHFKMLESADHLDQIRGVLSDIAGSMPNNSKFRSNCKQIIGAYLDLIFKNPNAGTSDLQKVIEPKRKVNKSPPSLNHSVKLSQLLRQSNSKQRICNMSYSALKKKKNKEDTFMAPSTSHIGLISDFKSIKGNVKFSKSRRDFDFLVPKSPGPAAYHPSVDLCKPKSPHIGVPNGGKRFEFSRDNSPGPLAYYPQVHYLSNK